MRWFIAKLGDRINILPEKDILPHIQNENCPCRTTIVHMNKGDMTKIDLLEDYDTMYTLEADEDTIVIFHFCTSRVLEESKN